MKLTTLANVPLALFLFATACGAVLDPTQTPDPEPSAGSQLGLPATVVEPVAPASPQEALLIEAPHAATTRDSLFAMSFNGNDRVLDVVTSIGGNQVDVTEQRIVSRTDQEVDLVIELPIPTGTYAKTLVSDRVQAPYTVAEHVLCRSYDVDQMDPRCDTTAQTAKVLPSSGPIASATWKIRVVDDVTGIPLSSCISATTNRLECVLPGKASAAYRIITSASEFADLWDGTPNLGVWFMSSIWFTGAISSQHESTCVDWSFTAHADYCEAHLDYVRFTAIDSARLELDPIAVKITANGGTAITSSPALTWDAGDDDLPGAN